MSVIELDGNTYQVNSVFRDRELAVVVEAGLKSLLARGAMPISQIGEAAEKLFRAMPPSEVGKQQELPLEDPNTGH
jgi:hypothetical protein